MMKTERDQQTVEECVDTCTQSAHADKGLTQGNQCTVN